MKEKRREKRFKVTALAWFAGEREIAEGVIQDLNLSGAKILSEVAFQLGEVVKITLKLPDGRGTIVTLARVLWQVPSKKQRYSHIMGVTFINIDKDESAKLRNYISRYDEVPVTLPVRGKTWSSTLIGDLTGGTTAAILGLPEAIAYGTIVFAPLGPDYLALGVVAGLIALCLSNLVSAGCRGVRVMSSGPYSLSSLMLASSITIILNRLPHTSISVVISLLFFIVFLSGLIQVIFGLLKLGELVKYVPYPVAAGLINGTALLIFAAQIRPMLGMSSESRLFDFAHMQPLNFLVGFVTILTSLYGAKYIRRIPAPFLGIGAGTLLYYFLIFVGFKSSMGPTIGTISFTIPTFGLVDDLKIFFLSANAFHILPKLISLAFGIAIVASLQTLIASVSAANLLKERSNTNRELIGQGLGNMASSFSGGIVSAGSQSRTIASFIYGGRTSYSRLAGGIFALVVLVFIAPLVAQLPKIVLAGILITLALKTFDSWSLSLFTEIFSKKEKVRDLLADLFTVIPVMMIMVVIGVFEAVAVGILISVAFFIFRMGKNIIRREYNGIRIRSNVHRSLREINYLENFGQKICVIELEGSLFFGTADKVAQFIEEIIKTEKQYIVLDLRHVADIDSTGANILARINDNCREKGKHMILSSASWMKRSNTLATLLSLFEEHTNNTPCRCFETINDALGRAEDMLLAEEFGADRYDKDWPLEQFDVLNRFSAGEIDILEKYSGKTEYEAGEVVFKQGTPGEKMFFLVKGRAQIILDTAYGGERKKIATLCPGTIFGEMAVIDHAVRSSNVVAETDISCYYLTNSELNRLKEEQPVLSHKLFVGFARELSKRIRIANREITELMG